MDANWYKNCECFTSFDLGHHSQLTIRDLPIILLLLSLTFAFLFLPFYFCLLSLFNDEPEAFEYLSKLFHYPVKLYANLLLS